MSQSPGNELLRDARRLEIDAAIGLVAALLCCLLGLPLGLWNLQRANELVTQVERRQPSLDVQSRVVAARTLAIASVAVSVGTTLAAIVWSLVSAYLSS